MNGLLKLIFLIILVVVYIKIWYFVKTYMYLSKREGTIEHFLRRLRSNAALPHFKCVLKYKYVNLYCCIYTVELYSYGNRIKALAAVQISSINMSIYSASAEPNAAAAEACRSR